MIWSDVFQCVVILGGLVVIVVLGSIKTGGFIEVWRIYAEHGRMNVKYVPTTVGHVYGKLGSMHLSIDWLLVGVC